MILKPRPFRKLRYDPHWSKTSLVYLGLMNEGDGNTTIADSVNENTGAITGPIWIAGNDGSALDFVTNDFVQIETVGSINFGTGDFTVVFSLRDDNASFPHTLIGKINDAFSGTGGNGWAITTGGTGALTIYHSDNVGGTVQFSISNVPSPVLHDGGWHHVGVVFNRVAGFTTVIDGVDVGMSSDNLAADSGSLSNAIPLFFGINYNKGAAKDRPHDGGIGHVLIYNRVLSSTEIQQLYLNPFIMFDRDDIELWAAATQGAAVGANPKGPLGHPLYGALAGPI